MQAEVRGQKLSHILQSLERTKVQKSFSKTIPQAESPGQKTQEKQGERSSKSIFLRFGKTKNDRDFLLRSSVLEAGVLKWAPKGGHLVRKLIVPVSQLLHQQEYACTGDPK